MFSFEDNSSRSSEGDSHWKENSSDGKLDVELIEVNRKHIGMTTSAGVHTPDHYRSFKDTK